MRKALTTLPWVRHVQIDYDRKQAIVTVLADKYDGDALVKALEKGGFAGKLMDEGE